MNIAFFDRLVKWLVFLMCSGHNKNYFQRIKLKLSKHQTIYQHYVHVILWILTFEL